MPYERSLAEVHSAAKDAIKDDMRVALPATVIAVHPDRQTVDVEVAVSNPLFNEYGQVTYENWPNIADVPLACLRGSGFMVWLPVAQGDSVILLFADVSMDTWRSGNKSPAEPVSPGWVGKHTSDSPIAFPCICPDAGFFADPNSAPTKLIIGKDGSQAQIRLSSSDIELGASATDAIALASKVATELGKISTALTSIVVTGVANPGGLTVTGSGTATYTPGAVASTVVKAQ